MKVCSQCGIEKAFSEFRKRAACRDGYRTECKECQSTYNKGSYERNKNAILARQKSYREANKEAVAAYKKSYRRLYRYSVTDDQYNEMLEEQKGCCAICGTSLSSKTHIDHNHKTGVVRGLLCSSCNTSLGGFKDSIEVLSKAIEYLKSRGSYGDNNDLHSAAA